MGVGCRGKRVEDQKPGQDGRFHIRGLDMGTYTLRETKAPADHNGVKETEDVTIQAAFHDDTDDWTLPNAQTDAKLTISQNNRTLALLPALAPTTGGTAGTATTRVDQAALTRAHAYDRRLLTEGGPALVGEMADPFTTGTDGQPAYESDTDYQSQLGKGDTMARIRIPTISVDLPIGHGASPHLLDTSAGHLYGTTLPVGDEGNTVIAAHRGLDTRMLFRRAGELEPGDLIWTMAAGTTTAWKVTESWTVQPGSTEERAATAVTGGHAWLTLYTCDPPGLNTRRLIVRAEKTTTADTQSPPDGWAAWWADPWKRMATITAGTATTAGATMWAIHRRRRKQARSRGLARRRHAPTRTARATATTDDPADLERFDLEHDTGQGRTRRT